MMTMNKGAFAGSRPHRVGVANKRDLGLVRPLGICERFFYLYSLAFPVHFCLAAHIEGAINFTKLGAALEQVRKRHSALRVCIIDDAETGPTFCRTDNPIEYSTWHRLKTAADWRGVVEKGDLSLPFSTFPGPLMRAKLLSAPDDASIVLTFHHAIVDGLSGARILHDVMRALAGGYLEILPSPPLIEEMIASVVSHPIIVERGDFLRHIESLQSPCTGVRKVRCEFGDFGMGPGRNRSPLAVLQGKWNDRAWRYLCSRLSPPSSLGREYRQDALSDRPVQDFGS